MIDPTSMAAFNFKNYGAKDDLTVNRNPIKGEDTSTINSKDQEGKSLAEHTQYEFNQGDQTTLGGSERGGVDDATEAEGAIGTLPWESDWTTENTGAEMPESNKRNAHAYGTRVIVGRPNLQVFPVSKIPTDVKARTDGSSRQEARTDAGS